MTNDSEAFIFRQAELALASSCIVKILKYHTRTHT